MRVISRYIAQELAIIIALCLGAFVALYLVIDFFEKIDDFLEAQLPFSLAVRYFLLKLPFVVQQGIPMAVLMGTLVTLGLISRNNELMALRAGGVSPLLLTGPILAVAFLLSLGDFALAEYLVPLTSSRANFIWNVKVRHHPLPSSFSQEKIWYKRGNLLYNIRVLHLKRHMLEGVTIFFFDHSNHLLRRLDARRAQWDGSSWTFIDGLLLKRDPDGNFALERFHSLGLDLEESPENFQHLEKAPEEMTLVELGRYVSKIEREGYDATRYLVDFHAKISFLFTSVIMALLAIGVALYQGKSGGIALGVAVSVAMAFIYLILFQLLLSVGQAGNIQPFLAAWIPNILFAMLSLFLLAHARH